LTETRRQKRLSEDCGVFDTVAVAPPQPRGAERWLALVLDGCQATTASALRYRRSEPDPIRARVTGRFDARRVSPPPWQAVLMATARTPRERNERGQGDRLRVELLEALARLVSDDERMAPLPVSLREVAREAGVTAPAIYRHFATKEELGDAAVADGFERLLDSMRAAEASIAQPGSAGDPAAALAAQARAYCRFAREHRGHFRLMLRWIGPSPTGGGYGATSAGTRGAADLAGQWRRAVTRLRERGIELTRDEDDAATLVWSTVHGRLALDPAVGAVWPDPTGAGVEQFVDRFVASLVATARRR
jgi:AcrR family transcriptional regulator